MTEHWSHHDPATRDLIDAATTNAEARVRAEIAAQLDHLAETTTRTRLYGPYADAYKAAARIAREAGR